MRIRVRPLGLAAYVVAAFVLNSFRGLAGSLSLVLAALPFCAALASLLQLYLSWVSCSFHQDFSCDHPLKGEVVEYTLSVHNESALPMALGAFTLREAGRAGATDVPLRLGPRGSLRRTSLIRCAYRGSYVIGLESLSFRELFSIVQITDHVEPRIFYVYPELVSLPDSAVEAACSSGAEIPGDERGDENGGSFDSLRALTEQSRPRRIAWKRWAATGIPAEILQGTARSAALRLVLDLRPATASAEERLACEDLAMSAAYSLLRHLLQAGVSVEFVAGNQDAPLFLDSIEAFQSVYDQSTSVIFNDVRFPAAAFGAAQTSLLVSTCSFAAASGGADICDALERSLASGRDCQLLLCPPPSLMEGERFLVSQFTERLGLGGGFPLVAVADARLGAEEVRRVFTF